MLTEFDFIQNIKDRYGLDRIGDDCAVLPKDAETDLVITADLLLEDIDFRLDWTTPAKLGRKALAVSLSDIAAMGAQPKWAMLTLGVPETVWKAGFPDAFYEGWFSLAREYGVELVGGDVSRTPDKIVINSIVGGETPKGRAILRSGAKPGDVIAVTGELGGAAGGLRFLLGGGQMNEAPTSLIDRHLLPVPRIKAGINLSALGVSSMIDISDGLSSDLAHICQASGTGAKIFAESIPADDKLSRLGMTDEQILEIALNGGEDFELLFTIEAEKFSGLDSLLVSAVGEVTAKAGIIELIRDGKKSVLEPKGYRHF